MNVSLIAARDINTLAQSETANYYQPAIIIQGKGSELGNGDTIKGRAKRKFLDQNLSLHLVDMAARNDQPEMVKGYWNTYHCQNSVYSKDGRLYGRYCKNRNCTLCCSIRKAYIINRYYPVISQWKAPCFVTLTVRSCSARNLRLYCKKLIEGFRAITAKYRKQSQRGTGWKLVGIKSLECCFNPTKRTYNPHLHLIVANEEMAEILISEWLKKWTPEFAGRRAQKWSRIENLDTALIETIKYGGKIIKLPDDGMKAQGNHNPTIYAAALHNIFTAMKGLRIFERFGVDLPKSKVEIIPARMVNEYQEWIFMAKYHDWVCTESELVLTSYIPHFSLVNLLENRIDMQME